MEDKGIFRSSIGGFNKSDVLAYIDQITAAWDRERQELTQTAEQARQMLQAANLNVQTEGYGVVYEQDISPGSQANLGTVVTLRASPPPAETAEEEPGAPPADG